MAQVNMKAVDSVPVSLSSRLAAAAIAALLGKEETISRIETALNTIK